jgi:Uma2 family endonuclease
MAEPPVRRRATYQDVLDAPDDKIAEVIDGELYLMSRPRAGHASVSMNLNDELSPPFKRGRGGPGGWIFLFEPELHFGEQIVVPDVAGWRRDRLPPIEDDTAFLTIAPDWLCEVLSKSTEKHDRYRKLPVYAAAGVKHVWLIHPIRRTLEVFRLHEGNWLTVGTFADADRVRAEPFDAIELSLGELWRDLADHANEGSGEFAYKIG